jgi:hypothetical protein
MQASLMSHWHASMHDTIVAHDAVTAECCDGHVV